MSVQYYKGGFRHENSPKDMQPYDVIVIGGGPAGSTAAAVLGAKGRRVVVLEKKKFPRHHMG
ncbi:MAG: FAD-dependent oxidoreductase [Bryobacteraceae bacterium]